MILDARTCHYCNKPYLPKTHWQEFCSIECRKRMPVGTARKAYESSEEQQEEREKKHRIDSLFDFFNEDDDDESQK